MTPLCVQTLRPEDELRRILKNLGYLESLWSYESRCIVVSVHAESPVELVVRAARFHSFFAPSPFLLNFFLSLLLGSLPTWNPARCARG